ncbi:L-threonine synthase [Lentzea xinjiangensis]|uniref:Threonine synthase n=1 Tax=Lentzea xinjiangensis TaxID=402600 RepID=A0A1H9WMA6_9PSEU|nr:threonine synthase [Lentzea xinjiangensis]SES35030.1 L-threonine synthase [Lentzea xinjiangensis]
MPDHLMPGFVWSCARCAATFPPGGVTYTCPRCGDGRLGMALSPASAASARVRTDVPTMWRYADLLPLADSPEVRRVATALPVGWTPLHAVPRLGAETGVADLWLKNDAANPTGALKDRASSLVVAAALVRGEQVVATASSGNAAASLAGVAAATGITCVTFVPTGTPPAKIAQLSVLGARVVVVSGSYEDAVALCWSACVEWGWYCRSTGVNPFTAEGKKTVALEICEQLGWSVPDAVVVPVGDGNIITGVHRGFADALAAGWISRLPRLIGVQAAGASVLAEAWRTGEDAPVVVPGRGAGTIADGIAVADPQDALRALAAVRTTGGTMTTVTEEEILVAVHRTSATTGVFPEPSSATAVAALPALLADGHLAAGERVVLINTGSGLKAVDRVAGAGTPVLRCAPSLRELSSVLGVGVRSPLPGNEQGSGLLPGSRTG